MKKNKINIILVILVLLLVTGLVGVFKYYSGKTQTLSAVEDALNKTKQSVVYYKTSDSANHARLRQISLTQEASELLHKKEKDSVAKILHLRSNQIRDILSMNLNKEGSASGRVDTFTVMDTFYQVFTYEDDRIRINDTTSNGFRNLKYNISVDAKIVTFRKRKWFLAPWEYYIDATSSDTSVHISGLKNIHIDNELSRWAISGFVGYDILNKKPGIGLSLNYNIIRFKKRKK